MKKLVFLFIIVLPALCFAQPDSGKGKRGGHLIPVSAQSALSFEIVDNGSTVSFYPMDREGNTPSVALENVDITVVALSTTVQLNEKNVQLREGAFTVPSSMDYPVYMYAISYTIDGKAYAVKHRLEGVGAPR